MDEQNNRRTIKTDQKVFKIIELLVELDGATVTEIATELKLAKSTVHQHLTTLVELEYIVKFDKEYNVGLRFMNIGESARQKYSATDVAEDIVNQLAEGTGERVQFVINEHDHFYYVHIAVGEQGVTANRNTGKVRSLHSSAGGKAMLAEMDNERVKGIIDRTGLQPETKNTITEEEDLFKELEEVRKQGYSINKGESLEGLWAIGASVVVEGNIVGALSIAAPRNRLENGQFHKELPDTLISATNELELKLRY